MQLPSFVRADLIDAFFYLSEANQLVLGQLKAKSYTVFLASLT